MEIMVFYDQFRASHPQEPSQRRRGGSKHAQAAVTKELGEDDVLVADPPLVKAHRHTHQLHRPPSHERDAKYVEDLLLCIGVQCQEWVGVLCEVVCSVKFPKKIAVVHDSVVPVEPEVQNYAVKSDLDWQPEEINRCWCQASLVGEGHCHQWPKCRGRQQ